MKKILLTFSLILLHYSLFATNFYWVGGNGNWSDFQHHWATTSGGTIFQTTVPTAFDDVYFDANSFSSNNGNTVTMDVSVAYTKQLTFNTAQESITLNFINGSILQVYSSATFSDGVKLNNALLYFKATTTDCLLTFKKSSDWVLSNIYFDGIGGSWKVTDSMVVANDIWLINGVLDVTGKTVRSVYFYCSGSNARGWNFANAQLYFYGVELNSNNLSYTYTGSTIHTDYISATGPQFNVNNLYFLRTGNYGYITNIAANVFTTSNSTAIITDSKLLKCYADKTELTFNNTSMIEGYWNKISNVSIDYTFEIGELTITGNDCVNLLSIHNDFAPATLKKTSGNFVFKYCAIRGIAATGGAVFSAADSRDDGYNTGITFTPHAIKTYYWIGNDGNATDPLHWSLSSGGPVAGCLPDPSDNVILDKKSFHGSGAHHANGITCNTLNATAIDDSVSLGFSTIYGSVYLSPLASFQSIFFFANTTGNEIDLNGAQRLPSSTIGFNGSGSWTLLDSLYAEQSIDQSNGYIYSNGHKIIVDRFNHFTGGGDFSHSIIETASFSYSSTGIFETSTFIFPNGGTITNSNTIGEIRNYKSNLTLTNITVKKLVSYADLEASYSITIDSLYISQGSSFVFGILSTKSIKVIPSAVLCSSLTVLRSIDPVHYASISKTSGTLQVEFVALISVHAIGGATFIANQSADMGDNDGWTFNSVASKTLYWINDGGDWDDPQHWSLSSGGNPAGCTPSIQDKVVFDAASFSTSGQVVSKQNDLIQLSGFTAENIPVNTALTANRINMYGDVKLSPNITASQLQITFLGKRAVHLTTDGASLGKVTTYADSLFLVDDLKTDRFEILRGYLNAAHRNVKCYFIQFSSSDSLVTDFTESTIDAYEANFFLDHLNFISDNFHLKLRVRYSTTALRVYTGFNQGATLHLPFVDVVSGDFQPEDNGKGFFFTNTTIDNLRISKMIGFVQIFMDLSTVKNLTSFSTLSLQMRNSFINTAQLYANYYSYGGTMHVGYLKIAPGVRFEIESGDSLYIHEYLDAIGNSSFPITIDASNNGDAAYIYSAGIDLCFSYLNLSNTIASGANFYAGPNSSDVYNNSGWDFVNTCDVLTIDAPLPACKDGSVTLTPIHPSNITGFLWTLPDHQQSNSETLLIDPLTDQNTGVYILYAGGQTRKVLVDYEVQPDVSIYESFNMYQTSPIIQFNSISYNNGLGYQISWYKDGILYDATNQSEIYPTETGNYYAIVTSANGCIYQSNTIILDNTFSLSTPFNLSAKLTNKRQAILTWQDVNTAENGFEIYFSTQPNQGYVLLGTTTETTYLHDTRLSPGTYYYKVRALKNPSFFSLYSNVASVTVPVLPDGDGDADYFIIYPVPAEDELHVVSSKASIEHITIYDELGRLQLNQDFVNTKSVLLNIHDLKHACYVIKVITNKETWIQKFIK